MRRREQVEGERRTRPPVSLPPLSLSLSQTMTGPPAPTSAIPQVKALLILDSEGRRIAVKYYTKEW